MGNTSEVLICLYKLIFAEWHVHVKCILCSLGDIQVEFRSIFEDILPGFKSFLSNKYQDCF